jgi:hypothetical protein
MAGASLSVASLAFSPGAVLADTTTFDYTERLDGVNLEPRTFQTVRAEISDTNSVNQVKINLSADGNNSSNVKIGFNIDPYTNVSSNPANITSGENSQNVPPSPEGDKFDLILNTSFQAGPSTKTFIITEITNPPKGLSAASFDAINPEGYYSVAYFTYENSSQTRPCDGGSKDTCSLSLGAKTSNRRRTPGPLPILGAAMAFSFSRRIRTRVGDRQSHRSAQTAAALGS